MNKMEVFQYAAALYRNVGYYTIRISPASQNMTTIVTEFGEFRYNCLPMGMCASGYIFQAKVDKLIFDIKGFKTCIDNIIILGKDLFKNHMEQLSIIFGRLHAAGLKVNYPKCSLGLKYIPYLGYVITRGGIKPYPNKVQGIMYLRRTATTAESQALIGMVQYYIVWSRQSHVLAPLIEAAISPKGRKVLCNYDLEIYLK